MTTTIAQTIQEHCMKPVGQLIKQARLNAGKTQTCLARKLGVTQGAIFQYEQSDTLQIATVEKIAKVLNSQTERVVCDGGACSIHRVCDFCGSSFSVGVQSNQSTRAKGW